MEAAEVRPPPGEGDVHRGAPPGGLALAGAQLLVQLGEALLDAFLETVDALAVGAALGGLDVLDAVERGAQDPLLAADPAQAEILPSLAAGNAGGLALEALGQLLDVVGNDCLLPGALRRRPANLS